MPERRLRALRQGGLRPPPQHACEDDAREALLVAGNTLAEAAPGLAVLSLRWHRSGAAGLLMNLAGAQPAGLDCIDWVALHDAGEEGDTARGAVTQGIAAEWRLHRVIYRRREEVGAVVSGRYLFSTALACLEAVRHQGIPAFHPDLAATVGGSIRCAGNDVPDPFASSEQVLDALDGRNACLLANLGVLAIGPTLAAAMALARQVESLAQIYWHVLQRQPEQTFQPMS